MEKIFKYIFKQKNNLKKKMAQDFLFPGSWAMVESTPSSQSVPGYVTHKDSWQFPHVSEHLEASFLLMG